MKKPKAVRGSKKVSAEAVKPVRGVAVKTHLRAGRKNNED